MQTTYDPIRAQYATAGWASPATMQHQGAAPGGAGAEATVTRLRWGRLLLVAAGLLLLAVGGWNAAGAGRDGSKPRAGSSRTVSGGGGVEIAPATSSAANATSAERRTDRAAAAPPAVRARRAGAADGAARRGGTQRAARRAAIVAGGAHAGSHAVAAPGAAAGAGGPAGELPYTGVETWIAAFLGLLLLAFGICVHVNAVRLGMRAMLYRRGILLRPSDCARVAQEHALPRVRVALSRALDYLLSEPATDFVSVRQATAR